MKNITRKNSEGSKTLVNGTIALFIVALIALGCTCGRGSGSAPAEYVGSWTGSDGSTLAIRADGSGDYKGSSEVTNGSVEIKDGKLSVTLFGFGKTMSIDEPPKNGKMKLDGIIYSQSGSALADKDDKTGDKTNGKESDVEALVKETVSDFADAIEQEDFSEFHAETSEAFQSSVSIEEMKQKFSGFIAQKKATVPVLRKAVKTEMNFTDKSEKTEGGNRILTATGTFQHKPERVRFDKKYVWEDGKWKVINAGIYINQ
jgi:hypothetical protein